MRGIFITFEGPEGSGKTTQSKRLYAFLKNASYNVLHLREPGGASISEAIRKILLAPENENMTPVTETLLYLAARAQLVREKIAPALKKGKIVILDRFHDSTLVYQGYAGGINLNILNKLGKFATGGISPDITFLLDIEPGKGLKRSCSNDRMERKTLAFHRKVRSGYLKLAQKDKRRIYLIKSDKDLESITAIIKEKIRKLLERCRK